MPWPSIDELVAGWVHRSYLKRDGWWAEHVLEAFAFLQPLGYSLTGSELAGVHFHQKGHYIWFHGPGRDVTLEYDPETRVIGAALWGDNTYEPLDRGLLELEPGAVIPSRVPLSRDAIDANIAWWAEGLQRQAESLLVLSSAPQSRDIDER